MELGSEFNLDIRRLDEKEDNIFRYLKDYNCIYTDSGRSALRILQSIIPNKGKILLPSYTCDSVSGCFDKDRICYYELDYSLDIVFTQLDSMLEQDVVAIVIMHYFGRMQKKETLEKVKELCKKKNILIIEDTTHSIFNKACTIGDYCICSLRKWFAIPDGGVLYSSNRLPSVGTFEQTEWCLDKIYGMFLKTLFLEKKYDCNQWYRELFAEAEEKLDQQKDIYRISEISVMLLSRYSVSDIIHKRRKNYQNLEDSLKKYGILFWPEMPQCPFVCPVLLNDRNDFRKYLIDNRIYCAVHWPMKQAELVHREVVDYTTKHILSLPIDQRYEKEHIDYMKEIIVDQLEKQKRESV